MNKHFRDTINAAKELKESFKCLSCKKTPDEPYFTGVCDHLLCEDCISMSNLCPICQASFFQKELHLNKMIKEAILCVNQIIEMETDQSVAVLDSDENNSCSLPELDLNFNRSNEPTSSTENKIKSPSKNKSKANNENQIEFAVPLFVAPQPVSEPLNTQTSKSRSRSRNKPSNTQTNSQSSTKVTRSQSTTKATKTNQNENVENSQRQRTQSASNKRVRKNDKGETPLHLAVMNEDINHLKELLNGPLTDINARDFAGWTPLHEAVNKENIEMVKLLVENNADINALGYQNNTPLHEAALNKRFECVKYLLESGANQMIRNDFGVLAKDFIINLPEFIQVFNKNINQTDLISCSSILSQSPDECSISSSYMQRKSKAKAQKKILIFGTSMKEEDKLAMNNLAAKLNIQVAKEMNQNVTHVVYNSGQTCSRTVNYMKAILMGIWVVNLKWLEESVEKNVLLPENEYEAKGSIKLPNSNGPFKGRVNASSQYPKLFEDCKIYFYGDFSVFDKQDLMKLVQLAGAQLLKREPKLERVDELVTTEIPHHLDREYDKDFCCSHFLLYDTSKLKEELKHKYLYSVRTNWLFKCIDEFKIFHPDSIK